MHDLPQNLLQQIKDFEEMFTVDREKLKQIVNHFVKELEKGTFPQTLIWYKHCADNIPQRSHRRGRQHCEHHRPLYLTNPY